MRNEFSSRFAPKPCYASSSSVARGARARRTASRSLGAAQPPARTSTPATSARSARDLLVVLGRALRRADRARRRQRDRRARGATGARRAARSRRLARRRSASAARGATCDDARATRSRWLATRGGGLTARPRTASAAGSCTSAAARASLANVLEHEDGAAADAVFYGSVRPRFVGPAATGRHAGDGRSLDRCPARLIHHPIAWLTCAA